MSLFFTLAAITSQPVQAQNFTVLHSFTGGTDGQNPYAPVVLDSTGSLYGQTVSSSDGSQPGTVFKLTPKNSGWIFAPLSHGAGFGGLTFAANGVLYGTGNLINDMWGVFKLQPPAHPSPNPLTPWTQTGLYSFPGGGGYQTSGVVFDRAGNMYGTTPDGGRYTQGVVYELSPSNGGWTPTVLYNFGNGLDGARPLGGVIVDAAGNLYGTTEMGGEFGYGTVFELSYSPGTGWTESFVYSFTGGADAAYPFAGLIFDASGNIYGATAGTYFNGVAGTVFKLTPSADTWTFSTVFNFGNGSGQCGPRGTLAMDGAGNLYGTTACLGAHTRGSVFKLTPVDGGWSYTPLHVFTGGNDGGYPQAGVALDANGNIYGTASIYGSQGGNCGSLGCGVVWEITR